MMKTFREIFESHNCLDLWRDWYSGIRAAELAKILEISPNSHRLVQVIADLRNYGITVEDQ